MPWRWDRFFALDAEQKVICIKDLLCHEQVNMALIPSRDCSRLRDRLLLARLVPGLENTAVPQQETHVQVFSRTNLHFSIFLKQRLAGVDGADRWGGGKQPQLSLRLPSSSSFTWSPAKTWSKRSHKTWSGQGHHCGHHPRVADPKTNCATQSRIGRLSEDRSSSIAKLASQPGKPWQEDPVHLQARWPDLHHRVGSGAGKTAGCWTNRGNWQCPTSTSYFHSATTGSCDKREQDRDQPFRGSRGQAWHLTQSQGDDKPGKASSHDICHSESDEQPDQHQREESSLQPSGSRQCRLDPAKDNCNRSNCGFNNTRSQYGIERLKDRIGLG